MKTYGVCGAGGFAREVMPLARDQIKLCSLDKYELVFVVDGHEGHEVINGHRVISDDEFQYIEAEKFFNIAIADYNARERIFNRMETCGIKPFDIIALNNITLDDNTIGKGCILCPFTTITSNSKIGKAFHANLYSYVGHDCVIGDFVTFAPNVHCNGNVVIEDYAYIGTGAMIRNGKPGNPLVIGKGSIVGMGAVVTKNVVPYTTVVGNPASELVRHTN